MCPPSSAKNASISIIIPARDEAPRLRNTIAEVLPAVQEQFDQYELIIVNDASNDATGEIADQLAKEVPGTRVIHLPQVHGLGGAFKQGLRCATMEYATVVHGDGGTPASELIKIWSRRNEADLIVPYMTNDHERSLIRLFLSRSFRFVTDTLFRTRLQCYGHFVLYRRELIQSVQIRTNSHAFQTEALVKLLRRGHSCVEVGVADDFESQAPTRSYQAGNVLGVAVFFLWTLYDVYFAPTPPSAAPQDASVTSPRMQA